MRQRSTRMGADPSPSFLRRQVRRRYSAMDEVATEAPADALSVATGSTPAHATTAAQRQVLLIQLQRLGGNALARRAAPALGTSAWLRPVAAPAAVQRDPDSPDTNAPGIADDIEANADAAFFLNHIDWIDKLPAHLVQQIDGEFSEASQEAALKKQLKKDEKYKALYAANAKAKSDAAKTKTAPDPKTATDLDDYVAQQRAAQAKALHQIGQPKETLIDIPKEGITADEGRTLARINFMGITTAALGTVELVKAHFGAVQNFTISGQTVPLHAETGARLQAAAKAFEERYPGAQIPGTTVGQSWRGRHQERHGIGMLGHAMGLSVDFDAYHTPHLKEKTLLLETIGGGPAIFELKHQSGRLLNWAEQRAVVKQMGQETMAHQASRAGKVGTPDDPGVVVPDSERSAQSLAVLGQVDAAYTAMAKTSTDFQASLSDAAKAKLHDLGDAYFADRGTILGLKKSVGQAPAKLARARPKALATIKARRAKEYAPKIAAAQAKAKAEGKKGKDLQQDPTVVALVKERDTIAPAMVDQEPAVAALLTKEAADRQSLTDLETKHQTAMRPQLQPMIDTVNAKVKALSAQAAAVDLATTPGPAYLKSVATQLRDMVLDGPATSAPARASFLKRLRAIRKNNEKTFVGIDAAAIDDPDKLKQALIDRVQFIRLSQLSWQLNNDLEYVFGEPNKKVVLGGRARQVGDPSVLQLLELGSTRNDPMPTSPTTTGAGTGTTGGKAAPAKRTQVFNKEFMRVMMEFGFAPGAAWDAADTMHFDFVEGFGVFANKGSYGPKGLK